MSTSPSPSASAHGVWQVQAASAAQSGSAQSVVPSPSSSMPLLHRPVSLVGMVTVSVTVLLVLDPQSSVAMMFSVVWLQANGMFLRWTDDVCPPVTTAPQGSVPLSAGTFVDGTPPPEPYCH